MEATEKDKWPKTDGELAALLGVKYNSIRARLHHLKNELKKGEDYLIVGHHSSNGRPIRGWTKQGAIKLAKSFKRSEKVVAFLREIGERPNYELPAEPKYLSIIEAAVGNLTQYKRHYSVRIYKPGYYYLYEIDLYFPDLKIAVECDEYGHSSTPAYEDEFRQREIEQTLGCEFIRFNPHEPNFNIGHCINRIFQAIIAKKYA